MRTRSLSISRCSPRIRPTTKRPTASIALPARCATGRSRRSIAATRRPRSAYVAAFGEIPHEDAELKALRDRARDAAQGDAAADACGDAAESRRRDDAAPSDNALVAYRKVLELDPENRLADAGLARDRAHLSRSRARRGGAGQLRRRRRSCSRRPRRSGRARAICSKRARASTASAGSAPKPCSRRRARRSIPATPISPSSSPSARRRSAPISAASTISQLRLRNARLYASFKPGQVIRDRYLDIAGEAPCGRRDADRRIRHGLAGRRSRTRRQRGAAAARAHRRRLRARPQRSHGRRVRRFRARGANTSPTPRSSARARCTTKPRDASPIAAASAGATTIAASARRPALPVVHVSWNDAQAYLAVAFAAHRQALPAAERGGVRIRAARRLGRALSVGRRQSRDRRSAISPAKAIARRRSGAGRRHSRATATATGDRRRCTVSRRMRSAFSTWKATCRNGSRTAGTTTTCARRATATHGSIPVASAASCAADRGAATRYQVRSAFRIAAPADTRSARVGFRVARDL